MLARSWSSWGIELKSPSVLACASGNGPAGVGLLIWLSHIPKPKTANTITPIKIIFFIMYCDYIKKPSLLKEGLKMFLKKVQIPAVGFIPGAKNITEPRNQA